MRFLFRQFFSIEVQINAQKYKGEIIDIKLYKNNTISIKKGSLSHRFYKN